MLAVVNELNRSQILKKPWMGAWVGGGFSVVMSENTNKCCACNSMDGQNDNALCVMKVV